VVHVEGVLVVVENDPRDPERRDSDVVNVGDEAVVGAPRVVRRAPRAFAVSRSRRMSQGSLAVDAASGPDDPEHATPLLDLFHLAREDIIIPRSVRAGRINHDPASAGSSLGKAMETSEPDP
jgi:hypothetical protein